MAISVPTTPACPGNLAPLSGLRVLDFSVQLPGPLATLLLAEAGATVVKVERPDGGDLARAAHGNSESENLEFAFLNRGKKSVVLNLKDSEDQAHARRLASEADVLVEQFRPGVMARLGLGYADLATINPRLVYCSISGYGQQGTRARKAGHDLNYVALAGLLSICVDQQGRPTLPHTQIADVGGGTFPAIINILLALKHRDATGAGCHLDISMTDNVLMWMRRALAPVLSGTAPYAPGRHPSSGGLARYAIYITRDGEELAVAAIEEQFWQRFCDLIGMPKDARDDHREPDLVREKIAGLVSSRSGKEWRDLFEHEDVCVEFVRSVSDALEDPHFRSRGIFDRRLRLHRDAEVSALPTCLCVQFRTPGTESYPALGDTSPSGSDIWTRTLGK